MVAWFRQNEKFYALSTSSAENVVEVTYENGKTKTYLKDSSGRKTHSVSFLICNKDEESAFWAWYDNVLLSRSQTVLLPGFIDGGMMVEYRMTAEPQIQNGQYPKECQVSFIEE